MSDDPISVTLDVDWAPEPVLASVVERLEAAEVPATFFATHESAVLGSLDPARFEVGLHPSFDADPSDAAGPIASLKALYPHATGGRSHALFTSSRILKLYVEHGLSYEANIFLPGHAGLHPVPRFADLVSIPFNWSDDKHLEFGTAHRADTLPLDAPGTVVLNFHPIHIAMNTSDPGHYTRYKPFYQDADALVAYRNASEPGVGTLFDELLARFAGIDRPVLTLAEVRDRYVASL